MRTELIAPGMMRIWSDTDERFWHRTTVSVIVATTGRPSLARTLASIDVRPGDEVLVYQRNPPGGDWGHTERNKAIPHARGAWLMFIDDDDWYVEGYRDVLTKAMGEVPGARDVPIIFRMQFPDGTVLWKDDFLDKNTNAPMLMNGNIGTPMLMVPNMPHMLHNFGRRYVGNFDFINNARWARRLIRWYPDIIVMTGQMS